MSRYQIPFEFSFIRAFLVAFGLPVFILFLWGVSNFLTDDSPSIVSGMSYAARSAASYLSGYKLLALLLIAIVFLRGGLYRKQYRHPAAILLTLLVVGAVTYFSSSYFGVELPNLSSLTPMRPIEPPFKQETEDRLPLVAGSTLKLLPQKPNLLTPTQKIVPFADFAPTEGSAYASTGMVGNVPALFILSLDSPITVASAKYRKFAIGNCVPSVSTMDGTTTLGCTAKISPVVIGDLLLPPIEAFVTDDITDSQVLLGANVKPLIRVKKLKTNYLRISPFIADDAVSKRSPS